MKHHTCCLTKLKAVVIYLLSLVLCGCSTPHVIGKFQGLKSIQKDTQHLHIILVHGIKKQKPGWSEDFHVKLAESLGMKSDGNTDWEKCIFIDGEGKLDDLSKCGGGNIPPAADGVLKSVTLKSSDEKKTVTITEVTWSPITTALKDKLLAYDKTNDLSKRRALFNRYLREGLVDDGFSDALAYAGEPGARIRDVVWKAICYSMTGKLTGSDACDLGKDNHRFAFIMHSLGSRIVFDALHVGDKEKDKAKNDNYVTLMQKQKVVERVSAKTVALYMLANQLPLLEMAGVTVSRASGVTAKIQNTDGTMSLLEETAEQENSLISRFMTDRRKAIPQMKALNLLGEDKQLPPVHIAAFSDPNDLLSYSLCRAGMDRLEDVEVADVWVRNAFDFGVYANPNAAHQDYWKNPEVIDLLVGVGAEGKQTCGGKANGSSQGAK